MPPYRIIPTSGGKYKVVSPNRVHAKSSTYENAKKQVRLLNAVEHNPDFKPKKGKK